VPARHLLERGHAVADRELLDALPDRGDVAAALFAERNVPFVALVTYADLGIEPIKAV
jgi:hypothetical protein